MKKRFSAFDRCGPIPKPPASHTWEDLMEVALSAAQAAYANDEAPVGALVVDPHGKIFMAHGNRKEKQFDPTAHAEILAIRYACQSLRNWILSDCVLVSTLEPCVMCGSAILQAKLAGLVFGAYDTQFGAISVYNLFDSNQNFAKTWRMGGVLAKDCAELLKRFFSAKRHAYA